MEYEGGIFIGPMNSLTDLGGRVGNGKRGVKDLNVKSTTFSGGLFFSATYKNLIGGRLEGTIGRVKSKDSLLAAVKTSAWGRYNRNLSFRSNIAEVAFTLELHPYELLVGAENSGTLSPYFIGGIAYYHFNPQALLNSQWIDLQPLHTEGQGFAEYPQSKNYKLYQFNVPLGLGIRYQTAGRLNLRLEYITRKLFTDYFDDVHDKYIEPAVFSNYLSGTELANALILNNRVRPDAVPNLTTARPGQKRGNPFDNDSYFSINLKVGYVFGDSRGSGGSGGGYGPGGFKVSKRAQERQLRCPSVF